MNKAIEIKHNVLANTINVEDVVIGDDTKRLLKCKAMLSDVYSEVNNFCDERQVSIAGGLPEKFNTAFFDLNASLMQIISDTIDYVSVDREYKVI